MLLFIRNGERFHLENTSFTLGKMISKIYLIENKEVTLLCELNR